MRSFLVAVALLGVISTQSVEPMASWVPQPGVSWQVQFSGRFDLSVRAKVFDLDGFDTSADRVKALHSRGKRVICYLNAGAYERWRPDRLRYPKLLLGEPLDGWPGERWVDIRRLSDLRPILESRVRRCRNKGFDAIEFDNVDGYANKSGFNLRARDQLKFNRMLARLAHRAGMSVGLKNDLAQVRKLVDVFDFAINEECFTYRECGLLRPFLRAGKAVFVIEYDARRSDVCPRSRQLGFSTIIKDLELGPEHVACRSV